MYVALTALLEPKHKSHLSLSAIHYHPAVIVVISTSEMERKKENSKRGKGKEMKKKRRKRLRQFGVALAAVIIANDIRIAPGGVEDYWLRDVMRRRAQTLFLSFAQKKAEGCLITGEKVERRKPRRETDLRTVVARVSGIVFSFLLIVSLLILFRLFHVRPSLVIVHGSPHLAKFSAGFTWKCEQRKSELRSKQQSAWC